MLSTLAHLFTPRSSNNYKAKALHLSSLTIFMLLIMTSQIMMSFVSKALPGVLGIASSITAQELIGLSNAQRAASDLPALQFNQTLANAAGLKAADMLAKNYWSHTSPDGTTPWYFFGQAGYSYLYAGENLARDFADSSSVVNAWMASSTHRDNLLSSRYGDIGIAVVHGNFQGQETTVVVQLFGTPAAAPIAQAPPPAEPQIAVVEGETSALAETTTEPSEVQVVPAEPVQAPPVVDLPDKLPLFSSFRLTQAMSISLTLILLSLIILDAVVITRKKIVRLAGKGLVHLVFLGILLLILLGIQPGLIL